MTPWPPDDELRDIIERLRCWYTIAEMARLVGHSENALRIRMQKRLGLAAFWRANSRVGEARRWTRGEVAQLYDGAGCMTQDEMAARLGRSKRSIVQKARDLGIAWRDAMHRNGLVSAGMVGELAGCHPAYAAQRAAALFGNTRVRGKRSGRRYYLDQKAAARLMAAIRPGRVYRVPELFGEAR